MTETSSEVYAATRWLRFLQQRDTDPTDALAELLGDVQ